MKFHSEPLEGHGEVPLADDGRLEAVVERFTPTTPRDGVHAYVLSVGVWRSPIHREAQLAEILGLVDAHGDQVVGYESLALPKPNPRTLLGSGTCDAVAARAREHGATLLVVDAQLSPSQTRNLEEATGLAVSDREIVILGVFQKHARSRSARIQIEIARLQYLRPRIRGLGLDMDQQAGGIGGRGAGETASELLARQLDDRLVKLERAARKLESAGALRRQGREGAERIALVGYTNAGKTSLMNALTGAELSARSRPFETLDTTSRALTRDGGDVLIGDTVGFIRDLPPRLLASFATTLAEAREASLLAVVVDVSDPEWPLHLQTTEVQLEAIGAGELPRVLVFNKADRGPAQPEAIEAAAAGRPFQVLSSFDSEAVDRLRALLIGQARRDHVRTTVVVPWAAGALTAEIHRSAVVLDTRSTDAGLQLTFEGSEAVVGRMRARVERFGRDQ